MCILNVAEKNSAAKNIAKILSEEDYTWREGLSKFNKIYEFNYRTNGDTHRMIMTSVSGHLFKLDFLGDYRKWYPRAPYELFDAPIEEICIDEESKRKRKGRDDNQEGVPVGYSQASLIKQTLEREVRQCDRLIIWTDCDREGENIAFQIRQVCLKVKPGIKVYRARFSEITPAALSNAFANASDPDPRLNAAVKVRKELDLRIGAAFTRLQTLRLKEKLPRELGERLISYGSCQIPTLGFVVERYRAFNNFVPEQFWKIEMSYSKDTIKSEFVWKQDRLFDRDRCSELYERCLQGNPHQARVVEVKSTEKLKERPLPMNTVTLEKLACIELRITAKRAMDLAEELYIDGFMSYPRTETTKFPPDFEAELEELVEAQTQDPRWGGFASRLLQDGLTPREDGKTDGAHLPIYPIYTVKAAAALRGRSKDMYELIVRHFLACLSKDVVGLETTVEVNLNDELFVATGVAISARNFLEVYKYDEWNAKEIPSYHVGECFVPDYVRLVHGQTTPPPLLRESDLIALMDEHGIGTDATHANHIETVKNRGYVKLTGEGNLVPENLGMALIEGYDSIGLELSKPDLRAGLEAELKGICEGTKDEKDVLKGQVNSYRRIFRDLECKIGTLVEAVRRRLATGQHTRSPPGPQRDERPAKRRGGNASAAQPNTSGGGATAGSSRR